ncbi:MAG: YraN family protein [Hyphomicrobiales bacterium]|nr:MAG: YraN family protein [Hyphomicrobiales bacterium]
MKNSRKAAYTKGHRAEQIAALYLRLCGYSILATRFKTPVGEIDLIARRGHLIAFTEVKWRASSDKALEAVQLSAQHRISRAALYWLTRQPQYCDFDQRFDVIALAPWRWPIHLTNAFDAPI